MDFKQQNRDPGSLARTGTLKLAGVEVSTPMFMPVGTQATVKTLDSQDLEEMGYGLILANTYHLYLRPGEIIRSFGGVKPFMDWKGALLTDSGGFQVFSLAAMRRFVPGGVEFQSHIDGSKHLFTPEKVLDIQEMLGSDIMMVLDDCPPGDAEEKRLQESLERTHSWARQSLDYLENGKAQGRFAGQNLFGIVQGGIHESLRSASLDLIQGLPFAGVALGGLSVGESREDFYRILHHLGPALDDKRPRYLMGVGTVPDFLEAIRCGVDLFDCVLPTRNARHGIAYTREGKLNLRNAIHAESQIPLDAECQCRACSRYSRGYIRHLLRAGEITALRLLTLHNLQFFFDFFVMARQAIQNGQYMAFYEGWKKIGF
ncbi:MAG: tRNA guanosine(34) transglycosylase Tgt [Spirochaetaceae bacterium]|nr:tRNA guanosine(34) transglycosylase Tgt [Spirochaetaceae bacterium]